MEGRRRHDVRADCVDSYEALYRANGHNLKGHSRTLAQPSVVLLARRLKRRDCLAIHPDPVAKRVRSSYRFTEVVSSRQRDRSIILHRLTAKAVVRPNTLAQCGSCCSRTKSLPTVSMPGPSSNATNNQQDGQRSQSPPKRHAPTLDRFTCAQGVFANTGAGQRSRPDAQPGR